MTRVIVRAVPWRTEGIQYLRERLPNAEFAMDEARNAMDTFVKAMRLNDRDPCVHLEDDALLCDGFMEKAQAVIDQRPDAVIQFFSRRKDDVVTGSRWDRHFSCTVAYYQPRHFAADILEYLPEWMRANPQHPTGFDITINDLLRMRKQPHWIQVPNLADHRVQVSAISSRRARARVSNTFKDA